MLGSLEEGWWLRGLNPAAVEILEQLNMDGSNENSLLPMEVETFTQFKSYQLESKYLLLKTWLKEKDRYINRVTQRVMYLQEQSELIISHS